MTAASWEEVRRGFTDSALWLRDVVAQIDEAQWELPGLGEWSVRDLTGHTSRALLTVEAYLRGAQGEPELRSPVEYFTASLAAATPDAVASRGRTAGAALGDDPVRGVADIVDRVLARVQLAGADEIAESPFGRMRLVDYLPTRTFELTTHTGDLVDALGLQQAAPLTAARQTLGIAADLAVERGRTREVLAALTGRRTLAPGFTIL